MATTIPRNKNNGLRNDIQLVQRARYGGLVGARIFAQVVRRSRAIAERHHSGSFGCDLRYRMFSFRGEAPAEGGFDTLAEVKALFSVDALLLAGWIHYLAFDLFIGAWIVRDSQTHDLRHWLVIPCLFFTLMTGPFGLLTYLLLKRLSGKPLSPLTP